jgi:hypothetical protein
MAFASIGFLVLENYVRRKKEPLAFVPLYIILFFIFGSVFLAQFLAKK